MSSEPNGKAESGPAGAGGQEDEDLVELMSEQGEANARVIAGVLESEDVEVMLKSHQTFSALPFSVDGMGRVRIMVRRRDLERAREIIEEYSKAGGVTGDLDWMEGGDDEER